ncbi:Hypothetical predicted protein [Mytilus galloprovincialis]|uniref:Uncharacterized protein n=1 Tax=Mytilus galloprovincialis TaxID=29158 RepID=A0A8B6C386_MYTGA|nr:Hypothetical predicted protein [Mytilus galloprovincialis]
MATEVHLVFDHPNRQGASPKDIQRSRRDITYQTVECDQLSPDTDLPCNWRSFRSVREEADIRVWLHVVTSTGQTVILYSPDTDDVYFIGLPHVKNSDTTKEKHLRSLGEKWGRTSEEEKGSPKTGQRNWG